MPSGLTEDLPDVNQETSKSETVLDIAVRCLPVADQPGRQFCQDGSQVRQKGRCNNMSDWINANPAPTPNPPPGPTAWMPQPGAALTAKPKRFSTGALVWLWLCVAANTAVFGLSLGLNVAAGNEDGLAIGAMMASLGVAIGYLVLLAGRKAGYYLICLLVVALLVLGTLQGNWVPWPMGALNLAITGLFIRPSWPRLSLPSSNSELKSRTTALVLAAIPHTGLLGIDRFYLGHIWMGLLKLSTAGGCMVLYVMDIVRIHNGSMRDKRGRPLRRRTGQDATSSP